MPVQMLVSLYNSAGERVRMLFDGRVQYAASDLDLSGSLLLTGMVPVGLNLHGAAYSGSGSLAWDGANDAGQSVASGTYTFKVEFAKPDGSIVAVIKTVQVQNVDGQQTLEVFNSAGELVARHSLSGAAAEGNSLRLGSATLVTGSLADGSAMGGLDIYMKTPAGPEALWTWDGRNAQGAWVNSGVYTLQLTHTYPGGRREVEVKSFTVLRGLDGDLPGGQVVAVPNPVRGEASPTLRFAPAPGFGLEARLYNLAGEAVGQVQGDAGTGSLTFGGPDLASGTYVAVLRFTEGGGQRRLVRLKVAIVR
jgi:hypothetical protein